MWKKWISILLAVCFLLSPVCLRAQTVPLEAEAPFELEAASVLLMDVGTGTVILEKNADEKRPVASVTKLMTILLVLEALDEGKITLEQEVTVSKAAAGMGGSQALLDAGGVYPLSELLKSLIIASANDSAVALAELLMGSEENFAAAMNRRAQELELNDTHYVNASGLPAEGQYTTARDVAALSREVLKHPTYFDYSGIWMDEIVHKGGRITQLVNTNRLIRFYEGADGVKTGSTNEAKYCVSATAKRGDERFLAVVLGASTGAKRFDLAGKLLTYAFDHYQTKTLLTKDQVLAQEIPVQGSSVRSAALCAAEDLKALVKKGEEANLTLELSLPEVLQAPLQKGQTVGEATILREGKTVARAPISLCESLPKRGFYASILEILGGWLKSKNA